MPGRDGSGPAGSQPGSHLIAPLLPISSEPTSGEPESIDGLDQKPGRSAPAGAASPSIRTAAAAAASAPSLTRKVVATGRDLPLMRFRGAPEKSARAATNLSLTLDDVSQG